MRLTRTTVTAHIPKTSTRYLEDNLSLVFNSLKRILKGYEKKLEITADREFYYELWTNRGYRLKSSHAKSKKGIAFAAIIAFKKHIGFYFLPLLANTELRSNIKPELKGYSKGLYTFHFDTLEPVVAKQVEEMVWDGWVFYRKEGLVKE